VSEGDKCVNRRIGSDLNALHPPCGAQDQATLFATLDAEVARVAEQPGRVAGIDHEADLGRQVGEFIQAPRQLDGKALGVVARHPIGRHQQVPPPLQASIGVEQAELAEGVEQRRPGRFGYAAYLQVGAAGKVNQAGAMPASCRADAQDLVAGEAGEPRTQPQYQAIARHHRPQRARAPALHARRSHRPDAGSCQRDRVICHLQSAKFRGGTPPAPNRHAAGGCARAQRAPSYRRLSTAMLPLS